VMKDKSYIGISFIVLVFGIWVVYVMRDRIQGGDVVRGKSLDHVSGMRSDLVKIGKAPEFSLTDQNGKTITHADYAGKVYVLEFFFSTCPTICPKMNANMLDIEKEFFGSPNFGIASITINPEYDTPQVLKAHAEALGVKSSSWHFLTGDGDYIMNLANKGFNLYAGQNKNVAGGFEHSGFFALIDKNGNIRSRKDTYGNPIVYYDGIEKDGVRQLVQDIKLLLNE
jgi:protein SCO1/2